MTLRRGTAFALVVLLLGSLSGAAVDDATTFLQTHYYLLPFGRLPATADSVRQATQSAGFSVIVYDGDVANVYRGTDPIALAPELVLSDPKLLLIDGARFLLREATDDFVYTLRPSEEGYELVIDPQRDLAMSEALGSVLASLQSMGIVGDELSLDVRDYVKDALKGPAPPQGTAIDSTLYGLLVARDWFDFAASKSLTLVGLRVEVVAELLPGAALESTLAVHVIEEAEGLAKLSLPIDQLLVLARSAAVGYVRPPYRPSIP